LTINILKHNIISNNEFKSKDGKVISELSKQGEVT